MAFEEPLSFTETPTYNRVLYNRWEISLHSVSGGNAETKPVPDFELVP